MKKNVANFRQTMRQISAIIFFSWALCAVSAAQLPIFSDKKDGLAQLFEYVLHASEKQRDSLTSAVLPTQAEYFLVFDSAFAQQLYKAHRRYHRLYAFSIAPHRREESDFVIFETSPEELRQYTGDARNFPGGYRELATQNHLLPDVVLYRVRLIKPGRRMGTSYDMWVFVHGQWKLFLRPWHLLLQEEE